MQYSSSSPASYLDELDDDWRKDTLFSIRKMILDVGPDVAEKMEYGMLAFQLNNRSVFHLNAQRHYVSLYVGDIQKIDPDNALVAGFSIGKGCVRVKKSQNLSQSRLAEFIEKTLECARNGGDTRC